MIAPDIAYLPENRDIKFNFYLVIVEPTEETPSTYEPHYAELLTAYTTNEFIFKQYLKYYESFFNEATSKIAEYKHITHKQFCRNVGQDFNVQIEDDMWILTESIPLLGDEMVYYNGNLEEEAITWYSDFDEFGGTTLYNLFIGYETLCVKNTKDYFTNEFSVTRKLLERVCKLYVPLVKLIDSCGYDDEEWFSSLPESVKINITKEANFPHIIDSLNWFDMISTGYQMLYYIAEGLGLKKL